MMEVNFTIHVPWPYPKNTITTGGILYSVFVYDSLERVLTELILSRVPLWWDGADQPLSDV